jgi:sugar O-acyltransferase (sialic acid O-acetyltransferase NeuD family)
VKLAFVGYGDLGRYIEAMVTELTPASTTAYFDDNAHRTGSPGAVPFAAHTSDDFKDFRFHVCIGYKHLSLKTRLIDRLVELGRDVPCFAHPNAYVHRSAQVGHGAMIYAGCTVDQNTRIGRGALLNNGVVVAHDSAVGDGCWLGPGVTLSGHVTIGACSFVGSGTTVTNHVEIGAGATVGLATAVTKHVAAGVTVIGNPMRVLDRALQLI